MAFHLIVAALIRRGDKVLLVREQGPDDPEPFWVLPGGVVESGELLSEALVREVREETGLEVSGPVSLLYVAQWHNPTARVGSPGQVPHAGDSATAFVFEVSDWASELHVRDPDGLVSEARFWPLPEAIALLEAIPFRVMREPIIAHLRGEADCGAVWLYRRQADGADELVARLAPSSPLP